MSEGPGGWNKALQLARRGAYPVVFASVILLHLLLTFYYERPIILFSPNPIAWLDFDTHLEQTWTVIEALDHWGKAWAYDVRMFAGYPSGTIFDADNKGWEIWTFALWKLGLPRGMAFNLFVLLAHLVAPWAAFGSARLFRLDRWASLVAMALGLCLWYFDGFFRWTWWVGMTSWAMAGCLSLLALALFYRFLESGRWWLAVLTALVMGFGHLVHPYSFVALVVPMGALYIRSLRRLGWRMHVAVAAIAAFTIGVNAWWIATALRFWHYILDSGKGFQGSISYVLTDYLGLIGEDPLVSGVVGNRTGFRFLCIAAALICLVRWRRERDDRFLPFAAGLAALFAVAYLGGYVWLTKQIQPYRFILAAVFMLTVPAASFLVDIARSADLRKLPKQAYIVMAILVFVALPRFARDVLYFVPALIPDIRPLPEGNNAPIADVVRFGDFGFPKHMEFKHGPYWSDFNALSEWLNENDDGQGRVLVEWHVLGEHLAWRTHSQIIGGVHEQNLQHTAADIFRRHPQGDMPDEELARYLEDYAIKWIVITHKRPLLENRRTHFEPIKYIPHHRIYESKIPWSYFQQNSGRVEPSLNTIEVSGTDPSEDVVLRFHFLETLVCRPGCRLFKDPVINDPVGFIRVPAPHPADFVIENGY